MDFYLYNPQQEKKIKKYYKIIHFFNLSNIYIYST